MMYMKYDENYLRKWTTKQPEVKPYKPRQREYDESKSRHGFHDSLGLWHKEINQFIKSKPEYIEKAAIEQSIKDNMIEVQVTYKEVPKETTVQGVIIDNNEKNITMYLTKRVAPGYEEWLIPKEDIIKIERID